MNYKNDAGASPRKACSKMVRDKTTKRRWSMDHISKQQYSMTFSIISEKEWRDATSKKT
jgi:hypothetical protein